MLWSGDNELIISLLVVSNDFARLRPTNSVSYCLMPIIHHNKSEHPAAIKLANIGTGNTECRIITEMRPKLALGRSKQLLAIYLEIILMFKEFLPTLYFSRETDSG